MTELVNVTQVPHQDTVTNKIDFSTSKYTQTDESTSTTTEYSFKNEDDSSSYFSSIGGSILENLPPVLEAGPWVGARGRAAAPRGGGQETRGGR